MALKITTMRFEMPYLVDTRAEPMELRVTVEQPTYAPTLELAGWPAASAMESKYRVLSGLRSVDRTLTKRIIIEAGPAPTTRDSASLDLPVLLAVLAAEGVLDPKVLEGVLAVGELSLQGTVRPVRGALQIAELAQLRERKLLIPSANYAEAREGTSDVIGVMSVHHAVEFLVGSVPRVWSSGVPFISPDNADRRAQVDLADVAGLPEAKRALEVAAAGRHNLLMIGPPGSGKTMLARRLPTILPEPTREELLEATRAHSAAGLTAGGEGLLRARPFRAPHHTVSEAGLVGDRHPQHAPRLGEVALARGGVLFLDELAEFPLRVLEVLAHALKQPENRSVQLVAATNACPCGWHAQFDVTGPRCSCSPELRTRYLCRIRAALHLFDLVVTISAVRLAAQLESPRGEPSATVQARVTAARAFPRDDRLEYGAARVLVTLNKLATASGSDTSDQALLAEAVALSETARPKLPPARI